MMEPTWGKSVLDGARKAETFPPVNGHAGTKAAEPPAPEVVLVSLSSVEPLPVTWRWRHWLPSGNLSILNGDPGLAKSTLTLDIAARVTRGWCMPPDGGSGDDPPAGVLLLSAEDDLARTIRPRLDAAGADVSRVHFLRAVKVGPDERPPILPWDLELMEQQAADLDIALVIVDPFSAFLGTEFDAHKDQDIRRCLHQLALLAHRLDLTLLLIRHLNKLNGGPALYRGGGSIAITGAARADLVVGRDPDDPMRHVLAMNKSNLGPTPPSLAYRILQTSHEVIRIAWEGECDLRPEDILWHAQGRTPDRPDAQSTEAEAFLMTVLAKGKVAVVDLKSDARAAGISWRNVERAKAKLRIPSVKEVTEWFWTLPIDDG